ncbi:MAG: hypothetical protein IKR81_12085 [Victivallales bacterium]|jgi:hypothetical protein|nr:hypothetical protein [Victivallales bacterium]
MEHGICKLCQHEADLCNSHLLPKAVFQKIRSGDATNHISVISDNTSRFPRGNGSVFRPMLCHDCEEKFSRYEKNVISYCLGNENHRALAKLLAPLEGIYVEKGIDGIFYPPCEYQGIWCGRDFYYFALSILWRNSTMRWGEKNVDLYYHALGELYENKIREFLFEDNKPSVENVFLICAFNNGVLNAPVAYFPSFQRVDGTYRNHEFAIPGIRFMVIIGKELHPILKAMFIDSNVALVSCDLRGSAHEKTLLLQMGTATETGKMIEAHKKWLSCHQTYLIPANKDKKND